MATREQIEQMVQEFNERGFNAHDVDYMEGRLSDDFIEHSPFPGLGNDKKGALESFRAIFAATPDLHSEVVEVIVSDNKFAVRNRFTGTDSGTGQMPGIPPTGKSLTAESIDVVTVNDAGEFSEHYGIQDVIGIMGQLGLLPAPPETTATE